MTKSLSLVGITMIISMCMGVSGRMSDTLSGCVKVYISPVSHPAFRTEKWGGPGTVPHMSQG